MYNKRMMNRILFWFKNSRPFSIPMTVLSWLVVFIYAMKYGGNVTRGILALIGIIFAHLATNLYDDYVDYKSSLKSGSFQKISGKTKCEYIKRGQATLAELLKVIVVYCAIASVAGIYLAFTAGWPVILLAAIGGLITLTYPKISAAGFSELYVGIAFGPLLFEGVYYVMCRGFSLEVLLLSLAVVSFTVGVVYMNNFLDYDNDLAEGKKSICLRFRDKQKAAMGLLYLYSAGYVFCMILTLYSWDYVYYIPAITMLLAYRLYLSAKEYATNKDFVPAVRWWYYPLENWGNIQKSGNASFYLRLFLSRNLMVWFSVLMCIAVSFI